MNIKLIVAESGWQLILSNHTYERLGFNNKTHRASKKLILLIEIE